MRQVLLIGIVYSLIGLFSINGQTAKEVVGSPVCPDPITYINTSGDTILLFPQGDNISHYLLTNDGLPVVKNRHQYNYARYVNGDWQPGAHEVKRPGQLTKRFQKRYRQEWEKAQTAEQSIQASLKATQLAPSVPAEGEINILMILVEFANQSHSQTKEQVQALFNGSSTETHAAFGQYYQQASHGKLTVNVDVVGWYNCDQNYSDFSDAKGMYLTGNLVRKAVDMAEKDGVDFSKYDNDGDGKADAVMIMHAGLGADHRSETQYIWPHSWSLSGTVNKAVTYDGVRVDHYVIACEMRQYNGQREAAGIGTFAHEFGHALGLPDLYDGTGKSSGLGHWAIMSAGSWLDGGYRPGNFCAWSRAELGWEAPQIIQASDYGEYELKPSTSQANQVIQIETNDPNEYFLLENRQKEYNDQQQPAAGLAVYHINREQIKKDRGINDNRDLPGIRLVEADFSTSAGLYGGDDRGAYRDLFPGPQNNTEIGAFTVPDTKLFNGDFSGVEIKDIQHRDRVIHFSLVAPQATISWSNTNLFESYLNDGTVRNAVQLHLNNAAFAREEGELPAEALRVSNLPDGLTATLIAKSATRAEIKLEGSAALHESEHDIYNIEITLTDAAFKDATVDQVYNSSNDKIRLLWYDEEEGARFYVEDFEGCAPPAFPDGWEVLQGSKGTASVWETCVGNNHTDLGRYGVQFYDKNTQKEEFWLISPAIDLTGFHDIKFSFWQKYDLNGEAKNKVAISTDKSNWHIIYDGHPEKNDTWEEAVAAIPASFEGETIYLGFCMYDTQAWGWFWDDVALYNEGANAIVEIENDPAVKMIYDTDLQRLVLETATPVKLIEVININGQVRMRSQQNELELHGLADGIYVVMVQMEGDKYKVIKFRK